MKAKIKTRDQLHKEGWRRAKDGLYLGESRSSATYFISLYSDMYLLGKEVEVVDVSTGRRDEPSFTVKYADDDRCAYNVTWAVFEGGCPEIKNVKAFWKTKDFGDSNKVRIFLPTKTINFPCEMRKIPLAKAKKIAKWVLSL